MSDEMSIARTVIAHLIPHKEPFETENFYGWRNCMFAALLFGGGVLASHILLACGIVTLCGFTGFAQASDITDSKAQLKNQAQQIVASNNETMSIVIGGQVFELNNRVCAARKAGNMDAEQSYRQQLQGTLDSYERVTGRQYRLQGCP